jgi:hypothetical protein
MVLGTVGIFQPKIYMVDELLRQQHINWVKEANCFLFAG